MSERIKFSRVTALWSTANFLPLMVGALLCIFSSVLLWTIERREQSNLQNEINSKAVYMASHVNADLRNRITSLKHMAKRCEIPGGMPKEQFTSDARAYLSDFSGLQALEWVDKDFIVRWIVPLKGNELAQNLNLAFEENRRMALEKAKESKSPTLSPPIDLVQGGKGFLAYFPVFVNGEFEGFVLAVFRIEAWMYYVFRMDESRLADDFKIKVFFDDYPVFEDKGWKKLKKYGLTAVSGVKIMDRCFSIHIWPTENYIENGKTLVPKLTGVFCFLLSVLMAYIVFLLQKAYSETRKAHAANKALEVEIREHKVTAEALKKIEGRIPLLLNSTAEAIYGIDLQGNCTFTNPSCLRMLGYTDTEQLLGKNMHALIHHSYPNGKRMPVEVCKIYNVFKEKEGIHVDDEVLWKRDGSSFPAEYWSYPQVENGLVTGAVVTFVDVTDRKKIEAEREEIINELKKALAEIKTLKGIVPICASCKKIRDDKGYWEQVESYIGRHTDAKFSHGICSECEKKLYAEFFREDTPKP